ncbi:MAG: type I restriction-modification system subunit M N-terminal domain-containing protein [Porticoccaceae bacterium]
MTNAQLVSKVWNYAHVLRDQGVSCGDYVEQITYLPFLKMGTEREDLLGEASTIPPSWRWGRKAAPEEQPRAEPVPQATAELVRRHRQQGDAPLEQRAETGQ